MLRLILGMAIALSGCGMARGHPDFNVNTAQFSFHETDLGDLSAKLGSISVYRRSGKIVYLDNFECGLAPWTLSLPGGVGSIAVERTIVWHGKASVRITPDAVANSSGHIIKRFPLVRVSNMGFEMMAAGRASTNVIRIIIELRNGVDILSFGYRVRFDATNSYLEVFNSAGAWQTIATITGAFFNDYAYHNLKLVIDPVNGTYERIYFNDSGPYDVSAILPNDAGNTAEKAYFVQLGIQDSSAGANAGRLDNFIHTLDEP